MKKLASVADIKRDIKTAKEISTVATVLIGQAIFTNLDQFMKRQVLPLNWKPDDWYIAAMNVVDGIPEKVYAACKNKRKKKTYSGPGIVVIKDIETGKLAVASTVDLAIFIPEFSYENLDKGKYGKSAQSMKVVELFVHECETSSSARNGAQKLRTRIKNAGLLA